MSGHFEVAEIIKNHKDSDVGKLSIQTVCLQGIKSYDEFSTFDLLFAESII